MSTVNSALRKMRSDAAPTRVAPISRRGLSRLAQQLEIDVGFERPAQRIEVEWVELIRRQRAGEDAHGQGHGFRQEQPGLADMGPEIFEIFPRSLAPAPGEAAGEQDGVDRPGAGAGKGVEMDAVLFKQAVERAPGEGAEGAAALQSQGEIARRPRPFGVLAPQVQCGLDEIHVASLRCAVGARGQQSAAARQIARAAVGGGFGGPSPFPVSQAKTKT